MPRMRQQRPAPLPRAERGWLVGCGEMPGLPALDRAQPGPRAGQLRPAGPHRPARCRGSSPMIGVDVAGTFTDVVSIRDCRVQVTKVPRGPTDPAASVIEGARRLGVEQKMGRASWRKGGGK